MHLEFISWSTSTVTLCNLHIHIRYVRDKDKDFVESLPHHLRCMLQQALKEWAKYYDTQIGPVPLHFFEGALHVKLMCVYGMPIVYGMEDRGVHDSALALLT